MKHTAAWVTPCSRLPMKNGSGKKTGSGKNGESTPPRKGGIVSSLSARFSKPPAEERTRQVSVRHNHPSVMLRSPGSGEEIVGQYEDLSAKAGRTPREEFMRQRGDGEAPSPSGRDLAHSGYVTKKVSGQPTRIWCELHAGPVLECYLNGELLSSTPLKPGVTHVRVDGLEVIIGGLGKQGELRFHANDAKEAGAWRDKLDWGRVQKPRQVRADAANAAAHRPWSHPRAARAARALLTHTSPHLTSPHLSSPLPHLTCRALISRPAEFGPHKRRAWRQHGARRACPHAHGAAHARPDRGFRRGRRR